MEEALENAAALPEKNNIPPESDYYCKLCAFDCVNSTGKLLHSLDWNHVEAYLTSQKVAPKRKAIFQAKSGIKSKLNQESSSKTYVLESGGQHSVSSTQIKDALVSHEAKMDAKSLSKNNGVYHPAFSLLDSQSSVTTTISGLTAGKTDTSCRNITSEQMDENYFSCSLTEVTPSFHPKHSNNLKENDLSEKLNNTSTRTSKNSLVVESKTLPADLVNKEVNVVDLIDGKFEELHSSPKLQDEAADNINEDVVTKFTWKPPNKDNCRRIIVEGISAEVDKKIIIRQFSKYGFIKSHTFIGAASQIEYFDWQSVERIFADQAKEKISINGKEIQIKKNWSKSNKGLQIQKIPKNVMQLFYSEEKLTNELDKFLEGFHLDLPEICKQQVACKAVLSSLKDFAPRVYPYGSRIAGLASSKSDLDIFVSITKPYKYFKTKYLRITQEHIIHDAAQHIKSSSDFNNVVTIPKAYVPLIRCFHLPTGLKCDLTFRYPYQVYNTGLILTYLSIDHRVRPLILLIRHWANAHGLLGNGKFTSYSFNLMCIFYLQQIPNNPILPSVSLLMKLARDHERVSYGCWDCGYCEDVSLIPKSVNNSSLFHLLKGFFKFFAKFDTNNTVVCPFLGKPVYKNVFHRGREHLLPIEFEKYKSNCLEKLTEPLEANHVLCIQDPFVHNSNVARQNRKDIVENFQICCNLYSQEQDYGEKA